ncbi:MAG: hypothetical protein K0R17_3834 [Rariglobus sp.]|jgi:hypothetical protein|nr:hypothetical protein [Rariglobus sp.]
MNKPSAGLLLLLIALPIAGAFGVVHDQISYSVSPEYFTRFKFIQFDLLDSPQPARVRAAIVGFLASWWMGVPIGLLITPLALMHRNGSAVFRAGVASFGIVTICTLLFALSGLVYGYFQTQNINPANYHGWFLPPNLVDPRRFLCVGYMHNAAYLGGVAGIPVAWAYLLVMRFRIPRQVAQPLDSPRLRVSA